MTYLLRHPDSGVYYFRRAVPDDLHASIGRTAVKKSLGTKDLAEAKRRVFAHAARVDAEFEAARRQLGAPLRSELSDAEVKFLVASFHHEVLAEDDAARIDGSEEDDGLYKAISRQVAAEGGAGRFSDEEATADVGLSARAYEKRAETLDIEFLKTFVQATEAMVKRHGGEVIDTPPVPASPIITPTAVDPTGLDLWSMFQNWLGERKPPRKTVLDFTTAVRRFVELHGTLPVHALTKSHVRAYKSALQRLPRACSAEMRRMTVPQLLERLDAKPADEGTTLKPGSINKAIGALQTVLRWVITQGFLEGYPNWSNAAADMKMHNPADENVNRLPCARLL